jgi:ribosome biogenesis GTPase
MTGDAHRRCHSPGTEDTPASHAEGLVVAGFRRHFAVRLESGETWECVLRGRSMTLACGDRVRVTRTDGGGVVEGIVPRSTLFYRSDGYKQKLIAANVTQVIGVLAPDLGVDEELINRWIVAAEAERCRLVLVANKSDMPGFDSLLARLGPYAALGYAVVPASAKKDIQPLLPWLAGERSVLIGQSGMGKSTILNAVAPGAAAATAEVSDALATGRHTTTNSTLHLLPPAPGGWIVDSPGTKAFGVAHLAPEQIATAFVELRPFIGQCRFRDCRHDAEPGCALREAVLRGAVAPYRLALMRTLIAASQAARTPGS